jgi:hypothetical protein
LYKASVPAGAKNGRKPRRKEDFIIGPYVKNFINY